MIPHEIIRSNSCRHRLSCGFIGNMFMKQQKGAICVRIPCFLKLKMKYVMGAATWESRLEVGWVLTKLFSFVKTTILNQVAHKCLLSDVRGETMYCLLLSLFEMSQQIRDPEQKTCQRPWTFEKSEFESRGRDFLFECLPPRSLPPHAPASCLMPGLLF